MGSNTKIPAYRQGFSIYEKEREYWLNWMTPSKVEHQVAGISDETISIRILGQVRRIR